MQGRSVLLAWKLFLSCLRRILLNALMLFGPKPRHVAFIMDGNRRFASSRMESTLDGHKLGYNKMLSVIRWCLDLGVTYISVYAFSIDNFKRSADEVGSLMQLAEEKYHELAQVCSLEIT